MGTISSGGHGRNDRISNHWDCDLLNLLKTRCPLESCSPTTTPWSARSSKAFLERQGFQVVCEASNGQEAVERKLDIHETASLVLCAFRCGLFNLSNKPAACGGTALHHSPDKEWVIHRIVTNWQPAMLLPGERAASAGMVPPPNTPIPLSHQSGGRPVASATCCHVSRPRS